MSETLYRKYRPKNFAEVIGQAHIVRTLSNSVKNGRIGQAYLFTGPRGTGKTSIARILAKTINCESLKDGQPCEKCPACKIIDSKKSLDIIEIDAASNTGVDNIRELRETVALANASLKYKVYIIDEVHMLSTGAFNALLKTLEEPPAHVVFILATTEIHKVPETILSRCQRFDFERLPIQNIIEKMELIAKAEKVKIEKEALEMIAISAEGGMRDAESLLGQIISLEDKNITVAEVEELLGTADRKIITEITTALLKKDSAAAIAKINQLFEDGYDLQVFNRSLINYLRQLMLLKIDPELKKHFSFEVPEEQLKAMLALASSAELADILSAINLFLEAQGKISASVLPQLPLEIAVIKATRTFPAKAPAENIPYNVQGGNDPEAKTTSQETRNKKQETNNVQPAEISNTNSEESKNDSTIRQSDNDLPKESSDTDINLDMGDVKSNWPRLLIDIRPFNHSLSVLLSNCQPIKLSDAKITLATPYDFYREKLDEHKNKLTVEEVFSKILKVRVHIDIIQDKTLTIKKPDAPTITEKPGEQDSLLDSALQIMGGKVVEE
ncbi:MAG: DNA polymerase III subunit gamma/tau [Parcubacteria group bacterium]